MKTVSFKRYAAGVMLFSFFLQLPVFAFNNKVPAANHTPVNTRASEINTIKLEADSLYACINLSTPGLAKNVFELALRGYKKLKRMNKITREGILSIIDFSKPSNTPRLFVIDLNTRELLVSTLVAHGKNSGMTYASSFSNSPSSNKSSLGFFVTRNTYSGENGYSLKLEGEEKGVNDRAYARHIVIHGAEYVAPDFIRSTGHLGRSLGCPAVSIEEHKKIIDLIKDGTCLFIYHPSKTYLKKSKLVNS